MKELDLDEIASEAYLYFYPLVIMEVTRRQIAGLAPKMSYDNTTNRFTHNRRMINDKWRSIARSNVDSLMSSAWADLSNGPAELTLPAAGDRYHMFQLLDMWTDTYAVVGTRTVGNHGAVVKIAGPGFEDVTKGDADVVLHCPTPTTWIIGRTNVHNEEDLVHALSFLDQISLIAPTVKTAINAEIEVALDVPPVTQVEKLTSAQYFEFASSLVLREGVHESDGSVILRMRHLGIELDQQFCFADVNENIQLALDKAPRLGRERIRNIARGNSIPCWTTSSGSIGYYGNDYTSRAIIARFGLAANPPEDAIYISSTGDSSGDKLDGSRTYKVHFPAGELPPAHSFWSLTVYDREGFLMSNRLDRFSLRNRDNLFYNADGSLEIFTGPECPDGAPESNWIPTIKGAIDYSIRLYTPTQKYRNGQWTPPLIERMS